MTKNQEEIQKNVKISSSLDGEEKQLISIIHPPGASHPESSSCQCSVEECGAGPSTHTEQRMDHSSEIVPDSPCGEGFDFLTQNQGRKEYRLAEILETGVWPSAEKYVGSQRMYFQVTVSYPFCQHLPALMIFSNVQSPQLFGQSSESVCLLVFMLHQRRWLQKAVDLICILPTEPQKQKSNWLKSVFNTVSLCPRVFQNLYHVVTQVCRLRH